MKKFYPESRNPSCFQFEGMDVASREVLWLLQDSVCSGAVIIVMSSQLSCGLFFFIS